MHAIILDTDPGVDDAMAIAYACAHPQIELLALTTVFGNVSVQQATANALILLERFGHESVPVVQGEAKPLVQEAFDFPDSVHGKDGLGNTDLGVARATAHATDAATFIVEQARARPNEITLIAVGPLTNIARALQLEPELPQLVRGLVLMGGTVDEPGNVSPVAEANFRSDPHAADEVFSASWPAVVVGLDVTHQVMLFDSDLERLSKTSPCYGDIIYRTSRFYVNFYSTAGAADGLSERGCAMHDATALVYLTRPELFTTVSGAVRVVHDGMAVGQLTIDRKGYPYELRYWADRPAAAACMTVAADAAKQDFLDVLAG